LEKVVVWLNKAEPRKWHRYISGNGGNDGQSREWVNTDPLVDYCGNADPFATAYRSSGPKKGIGCGVRISVGNAWKGSYMEVEGMDEEADRRQRRAMKGEVLKGFQIGSKEQPLKI
jgi:hypothetical protein